MSKIFRRWKRWVIVLSILTVLITGVAFTDNHFEISKNLDIFVTLFKELNTYYVDEIDPGKLIKISLDEMLKSLDPYTVYIPESEAEDLRILTTGTYGGVGAIISKKGDYIYIAEPYEGFPVNKADLRAGDIIIDIDGKSMKDKTVSDVSSLLKGQPGTEVKLLIKRPFKDETFSKTLVRSHIKVYNIPYYGMINDQVGYFYLSGFKDSAEIECRNALLNLKKNPGLKGIIFDLRSNPGGLLNEAVKIAGLFMNQGDLVVKTKGKVDTWNKDYKTTDFPVDLTTPLIVLVNNNSASASEIVSGALQDIDRAVIVGQRTFGKGLVQTTRRLSYNAQLKVTTSKYYIPSGRCIQALDYSHKDEQGRAIKYPDSLRTAFKTRSGRKVYDGDGINPDIKIEPLTYPEIVNNLMRENLIFDFATKYRNDHSSISPPEKFALSDNEYNDFVKFVIDKKLDYKTSTEKILGSLEKEAKSDKYFESIKPDYDTICAKVKRVKQNELYTFKDKIKDLLEEEIVSRYYFQKGRIIYGIYHDEEVKKAISIFSDPSSYYNILKPGKN